MRLTKELPMGSYIAEEIYLEPNRNEQECVYKLGQLEDIEDELGIDLGTFFRALKNGVYYFTNGNQLTKDYVWLMDNYMNVGTRDKLSYSFITAFERRMLLFKDYGKTWSLDKNDLTKE